MCLVDIPKCLKAKAKNPKNADVVQNEPGECQHAMRAEARGYLGVVKLTARQSCRE